MDKQLEKQVRKYVQVHGPSVSSKIESNGNRHVVSSQHKKGHSWTSVHDNAVEAKMTAHRLSKKAEKDPSGQQTVDHSFHGEEV